MFNQNTFMLSSAYCEILSELLSTTNIYKSPVSEIETGNYHEMSSVWSFICVTALWKNFHTRWFRDMKHSLCSLNTTKNI